MAFSQADKLRTPILAVIEPVWDLPSATDRHKALTLLAVSAAEHRVQQYLAFPPIKAPQTIDELHSMSSHANRNKERVELAPDTIASNVRMLSQELSTMGIESTLVDLVAARFTDHMNKYTSQYYPQAVGA